MGMAGVRVAGGSRSRHTLRAPDDSTMAAIRDMPDRLKGWDWEPGSSVPVVGSTELASRGSVAVTCLDGALTATLTADLTADRRGRNITRGEAPGGPVRQEGTIRENQLQDGISKPGWHSEGRPLISHAVAATGFLAESTHVRLRQFDSRILFGATTVGETLP